MQLRTYATVIVQGGVYLPLGETAMQLPSFLRGEGFRTHAIAIGIGAVAAFALTFNWFGFGIGAMLGSTAKTMANNRVNAEVVTFYTPHCVKHFEAQTNMPSHWSALKKAMANYDQQDFIEKAGFATPPGTKEANDDVANACASKLAAALKKQPDLQAKSKT
jgi:hypothetical protein